jgi:hypothetical protein
VPTEAVPRDICAVNGSSFEARVILDRKEQVKKSDNPTILLLGRIDIYGIRMEIVPGWSER